ncbi:nodulation protein NfeD [Alkaliphilus sp. MSJ-5]|uniref:Nodulation protein NfeD n=1 Tax=Alkaliphilus flagellatus TaxID=2841507 RepID=A0ABS6FZJ3_9FIRM|nr:NfeD family protein [Alkaliphilus flagellatus]MBU5675670.1 nodulation protein NfeD [Alkaliphilus flagellatus]
MTRKKICCLGILIFTLLFSIVANANVNGENVYVIPIRGEITPAVYQYVEHNLSIIEKDPRAVAVIFEIDTYGGRIDSAEKISQLILNTSIPTISFVNTKAESAGVLLTISSDTIAMAPSSTIGSAETIPNTEKILSTWVSILRSVAQEKGREEDIVAAMADQSIAIPGIIERGRLLNLTTLEAKSLGFTDIVASDYDQILSSLSLPYSNIIMAETTNSIHLANFASNVYIAPLLLAAGFIGLLVEIFMPGFGIGGTVSLISFALYFGGNILAGNTSLITAVIFLVGILLLGIEAFIPGFGVAGVGGIVCVAISIFLASSSVTTAMISIFVSLILTIVVLVLIFKYAPRNKHFSRIVLNTKLDKEKGYTSFVDYSKYIGQTGIVTTPLRPSGTISIDEELLDVISEGQFIEKEELVKISRIEGSRIVVQKIN